MKEMKKTKKTIKNISIGVLSGLFILQLLFLWSSMQDDFKIQTIFSSDHDSIEMLDTMSGFIRPKRVLLSSENNKATAIYEFRETGTRREIDRLVSDVFERAVLVKDGIAYKEIKSIFEENKDNVITLEYGTALPLEIFINGKGNLSNDLQSGIQTIKQIMIFPNATNDLEFFIFDGEKYHHFSTEVKEFATPYLEAEKGVSLVSVEEEDLKELQIEKNVAEDIWVPKEATDDSIKYPVVKVNNPYETEGELLFKGIEKMIDVFFEYPAKKQAKPTIPYTFSDDEITVRYYPNHVLEYTSYKKGKTESNSLQTATMKVSGFLKKDIGIQNKYYISDIVIKDNSFTFYLDYIIGEYPLYLSESLQKETGLSHMIEIEVKQGVVTQYKRLTDAYALTDEIDIETMSLEESLKTMKSRDIQDIEIGYKVNEEELELSWCIDEEVFMPLPLPTTKESDEL